MYLHSAFSIIFGFCSSSSKYNTCPSSRVWLCPSPHCLWVSPLPPCPLSPPAPACSPSPPSWLTTPMARPRRWKRTRPERLQRERPEERTGISQTSANAARRFGGRDDIEEKCWKWKGESVTVNGDWCTSGCLSAEWWLWWVTTGTMTSKEDGVETSAENESAEWLWVRVKCSYYLVVIDSVHASRFEIDAFFFFLFFFLVKATVVLA